MTKPETIGGKIGRLDGRGKVTGAAIYVDDIQLPDMLHAATVRSEGVCGKIRSVVFDPNFDWTDIIRLTAADISRLGSENVVHLMTDDQPFLASDEINHPDEPVALVAAPTREMALKAAKHVRVEVTPKTPVLDPAESTVVQSEMAIERGDLDAAFDAADRVIEDTYETGLQEQLYIEPQGMVAIPGEDGAITIKGSMQCPFYTHRAVKRLLGLPDDKISIVQTVTGGGFGGKEEYPSMVAGHAALLALESGRPVKLVYERSEDLRATTKRHASVIRHRTAVRSDGRLLAADIEILLDGGAYVTLSPVVLSRAIIHAAGPYDYDALRIHGRCMETNSPPAGAFRGFGAPQVTFAYERHMDRIARDYGMDPLEFRRKNQIRRGGLSATGQVLDVSYSGDLVLERAVERSNYIAKRDQAAAHNEQAKAAGRAVRRGVGLSYFFHGAGFTGNGEAKLKGKVALELTESGNIRIYTASTDIGQGTVTIFPQIAADTLGIDISCIEMAEPDTGKVPDSGPTVASRTAMVVGKIVMDAATEIRDKVAAFCPGKPFAEAAQSYIDTHGPLTVNCTYRSPPNIEWDDATYQGDAYPCYAWSADIAEVEVDLDTAEVVVTDFCSVADAGRVLHQVLAEGQIEGGALQGVGFATMEEHVVDNGRIVNDRLTTYIIPTTLDSPDLDVELVEVPFPGGPFGAKGIGEMPIDGAAPAVIAAIEHAVGRPVPNVLPLTPEKLLATVEAAR